MAASFSRAEDRLQLLPVALEIGIRQVDAAQGVVEVRAIEKEVLLVPARLLDLELVAGRPLEESLLDLEVRDEHHGHHRDGGEKNEQGAEGRRDARRDAEPRTLKKRPLRLDLRSFARDLRSRHGLRRGHARKTSGRRRTGATRALNTSPDRGTVSCGRPPSPASEGSEAGATGLRGRRDDVGS